MAKFCGLQIWKFKYWLKEKSLRINQKCYNHDEYATIQRKILNWLEDTHLMGIICMALAAEKTISIINVINMQCKNRPNSLFFIYACPKLILPLRRTMNVSAEESITVLPTQNHVWNGIFGWMRWLLHVCEMGICWIAIFLLFGRVIRDYIE